MKKTTKLDDVLLSRGIDEGRNESGPLRADEMASQMSVKVESISSWKAAWESRSLKLLLSSSFCRKTNVSLPMILPSTCTTFSVRQEKTWRSRFFSFSKGEFLLRKEGQKEERANVRIHAPPALRWLSAIRCTESYCAEDKHFRRNGIIAYFAEFFFQKSPGPFLKESVSKKKKKTNNKLWCRSSLACAREVGQILKSDKRKKRPLERPASQVIRLAIVAVHGRHPENCGNKGGAKRERESCPWTRVTFERRPERFKKI